MGSRKWSTKQQTDHLIHKPGKATLILSRAPTYRNAHQFFAIVPSRITVFRLRLAALVIPAKHNWSGEGTYCDWLWQTGTSKYFAADRWIARLNNISRHAQINRTYKVYSVVAELPRSFAKQPGPMRDISYSSSEIRKLNCVLLRRFLPLSKNCDAGIQAYGGGRTSQSRVFS